MWIKKLWVRTKEVAAMYTGTFIVVMIVNQLLFFGFCLNPVCLVAAMPHVLLITVAIGTWLNKENIWGHKKGVIVKTFDTSMSSIKKSIDNSLDNSNDAPELRESHLLKVKAVTSPKQIKHKPPRKKQQYEVKHRKQEFKKDLSEEKLQELAKWFPHLNKTKPSKTSMPKWMPEIENTTTVKIIDLAERNKRPSSFSEYGVSSLWHMTHRDNIAGIMTTGILSNFDADKKSIPIEMSDPNKGLQCLGKIDPHYGRLIFQYAPLYIKAKNPMLYARRKTQNQLCLIEVSLAASLMELWNQKTPFSLTLSTS
jgi:hypothetical protein